MNAENWTREEPGLYSQRLSSLDYNGKPCLFLDRDGVLVEETHYLHRSEDVVLIGNAAEAVAAANAAGVAVVMVTNQAGVGRGYYSWYEFERVQQRVLDLYEAVEAHCDLVLACAYHADGIPPYQEESHSWRKPNPGMLLEAARLLGVDLSLSHIVGDTLADLTAGVRAGLAGGTLVLTGHGRREWSQDGEAAFALYRHSSFKPRVAADANEAIRDWLAELTARASAA